MNRFKFTEMPPIYFLPFCLNANICGVYTLHNHQWQAIIGNIFFAQLCMRCEFHRSSGFVSPSPIHFSTLTNCMWDSWKFAQIYERIQNLNTFLMPVNFVGLAYVMVSSSSKGLCIQHKHTLGEYTLWVGWMNSSWYLCVCVFVSASSAIFASISSSLVRFQTLLCGVCFCIQKHLFRVSMHTIINFFFGSFLLFRCVTCNRKL